MKHCALLWRAALCCTLAFLCLPASRACTSAVVSGRVTPDGRPLLWKHRDTGFLLNHVEYVRGERYDFIAVVNSADFRQRHEAWIGTNEAGFALMNTQSYNLVDAADDAERGPANGRVIWRALEVCATVDDFCHFLDTLAKPSGIEANFGAIDARGGAVMLEVDERSYRLFDANNPADAPYGYVARTNFSFSGRVNAGAGYVRYMETDAVLMQASATGSITPRGIFDGLSRSFRNRLLDIDLRDGSHNRPQASGWFVDQDFIPRASTSCSVVVQGVKPGEQAGLTTMWTLLGYPPTGVAVPLWVDEALPAPVRYDGACQAAPLSAASLRLAAEHVFCYRQGMGTDRYLCWENLYNREGTGLMQRLAPLEQELFGLVLPRLEAWRQRGRLDRDEMKALYARLEERLRDYCAGTVARR